MRFYDGEILNDKKNGKGKEYNPSGVVLYEGEFLKGKYWTGKFFNESGNAVYSIEKGTGYGFEYFWNKE